MNSTAQMLRESAQWMLVNRIPYSQSRLTAAADELDALAAELAAVKAQLARYTMVTREQFGYQEGLDNTIAMANYGEYLRRLSVKESEVQK